MIEHQSKNAARQRSHRRLRKGLAGHPGRPRLNVYRSLNHIYAQVIDDSEGRTLVAASSTEAGVAGGGNIAGAKEVGKKLARRALEKQISQVVFDRGGYQYHGRVKALAEAAREAGLKF